MLACSMYIAIQCNFVHNTTVIMHACMYHAVLQGLGYEQTQIKLVNYWL